MNKPTKPNITIPESFAANGVKTDFDNNKILNGFDRSQPDVLAGDNLNKFIDDTYQGLNYGMAAADAINLINEGETLTVVDGKLTSGATGGGLEICDIGMALYVDETKGLRRYLNGQIVDINTNTQAFLNRLKKITTLHPSLLCTEDEWQTAKTLSDYGQVGKFVFNYAEDEKTVESVRLPAVVNVQGLLDLQNLGMTVEAGLPNIKGGTINGWVVGSDRPSGAINAYVVDTGVAGASQTNTHQAGFSIDASRSNPIYGATDTVQQEQIQYPYFIQIATGQETEVNIRNDIESIVPYTLFDSKYSEAKQYNASWVLGGSTLSKSVYPTAYEAALVEYNSEIADGTTVELPSGGSYTKRGVSGGITVKLSTDETVTEYDWKLDTVAEILTVPTASRLASGKAVVGNGMTLGLTDGTANFGFSTGTAYVTAPRVGNFGQPVGSPYAGATISHDVTLGVTTDPTKSGIELSGSNLYLYFFVASVAQNAPLANLGRIEEQLAQRKVVVETYKNGNSWYRVWSDGWCEQGGVFDRGSDITTDGSVVISLVHPFKDTHYTLMVNNGGNSKGSGFGWYVESNIMNARALSKFYVYTWKREVSNRYISWYACGY